MGRKIITCTGYGGTGSSAITDLLKEFDNGLSLGDAEFYFLQEYDAISDLEYFLIDGNHRSKVSLAIKRFKKYIDNKQGFYNKYFGNKFQKFAQEYIDSLVDARFKKAVSSYELNSKIKKFMIFRVNTLAQLIIAKLSGKDMKEFAVNIPLDDKYYSVPDKDRFYKETKKFTTNLFELLDKEHKYDFIAVDQLVPAMGIERYMNYVEDLKVIVVDRDPRDLYLLNETHWKGAAYICDTSNIYEYIKWYETMRRHREIEKKNSNILYLMIEELIYEYDNTLKKIYNFLEINSCNHIEKKRYFHPDISKRYTKLWEKFPKYKKNIEIIEEQLGAYCYKK